MEIEVTIGFETVDKAGVVLTSKEKEYNLIFCELALFTVYLLKTLYNFGPSEVSTILCEQLRLITETLKQEELTLSQLTTAISKESNMFPQLTAEPVDFKKKFEAIVEIEFPLLRFKYNLTGFGWLSKGVGYYAPQSIFVLLVTLSQKHLEDQKFQSALAQVSLVATHLFANGEVNMRNYPDTALGITFAAIAEIYGKEVVDPFANAVLEY